MGINEQEGLYTVCLRGREQGQRVEEQRVISAVSRCLNPYEKTGFNGMMEIAALEQLEYIVSNTTEVGIVYDPSCQWKDEPAASFPGKLTQVLHKRFLAGRPGVIILACELIENNGKELQKCVNQYARQWELGDEFARS